MKLMLIAGNWKMNTDIFSSVELIKNIKEGLKGKELKSEVLACPPFTNIVPAYAESIGSEIKIGAQNCYFEPKGAFTGEISVEMLKKLGCSHVIVGHSERRKYFGESSEIVNKKAKAVLSGGMKVIVCIGETLEERQSGATFDVLSDQIAKSLAGLSEIVPGKTVVAYEPVWAIGTGLAATPEQIEETHNFIKKQIEAVLGESGAKCPVLYGGSVTEENAKSILSIENVNGALIGGASLKAETFLSIIATSEAIIR
jgi:triosephosphate isomerase